MISHFFDNIKKKSTHLVSGTRAFTLIELMVTVGIFVLMTALILARYNSYYSGTVFNNMAYDVALTIRQAQVYGISVKRNETTVPNTNTSFTGSYGVNFTKGSPDNEFKLYAYSKTENPVKGLLEKTYTLKRGAKVDTMCAGTKESDCTALQSTGELDIVFQRPNPEPIICLKIQSSGTRTCGHKYAKIELIASDGVTKKSITVNGAGQISIQ